MKIEVRVAVATNWFLVETELYLGIYAYGIALNDGLSWDPVFHIGYAATHPNNTEACELIVVTAMSKKCHFTYKVNPIFNFCLGGTIPRLTREWILSLWIVSPLEHVFQARTRRMR